MDPIKNDFKFEYFSFLKGIDRANPSGKFWSTIDRDNAIAPAKLPKFSDLVNENAIPIEIPSIKFLRADDKMSRNLSKIAPNIKPNDMPNKLFSLFSDNSVAGIINDHIDDEIIIPAVKPKNIL